MARIAVVHVPFYSHVEAAMRLTGVISRQGHELLVIGPEYARAHAEACGASFELLDPPMPTTGGLGYFAQLAETTEQAAEELIECLYAADVDLLIHDSQATWGRVAGDYLGLPRIISHPMFPVIANYTKPSPADPRWMDPPPFEEAYERFSRHCLSIARRWGVEFDSLHRMIHSPGETWVAFTTERVVSGYPMDPGWHCIGPLMPVTSPSVPADPPLVYVCFGTAYNRRPELFRAVVSALADEPVEVLVSVGKEPTFVDQAALSAEDAAWLPDNVTLRDFAPNREVLTRASVHVTHGGCNSVHETLLAGVPMVCIPQALDQFPLGACIEQLGVGVTSGEEPAQIREAVQLVLEGNKARSRALELREHLIHYDGERRVAAVLDEVLNESRLLTA